MSGPLTYGDKQPMEHPDLREKLLGAEDELELDALLQRTRAAVAADTGPAASVRRLPTSARVALVLFVAVGVSAAVALGAPRPDLLGFDPLRMALVLGGSLLAALAAVGLAMRPAWRPALRLELGLAGLAFAIALPLVVFALPETEPQLHVDGSAWYGVTAVCFTFASLVAVVVVATWRLVERRSWNGPLRWATALAGGGAIGALALQLHCPVTQVSHMVIGHGSTGLVWATLGALAVWGMGRR